MVHPSKETTTMGQAGLCTAPPQTDSPLNSGLDSFPQELMSNGSSIDIVATLSALLENKTDVKAEDLLLKLQSLINENLELKDTITQNNLALRQQMNLLVQWHQQVEKQQRLFREELNNSNKQANSLQQENTLLKSTLTSLKNSNPASPKFQELDNTIQELYQQLNASERKLQITLEEKESISSQRTKLEGELTLLRCDLAATKSEFERLQLQRQELLSTAKELRERLQTREMQLGREKNQNISEDVEKLYKTLQKEREAAGVLFQELEEARSQVEHLESELKTARTETQKYKSKYQLTSRNDSSPPLSPSLDSKLNDSDVRKLKDEAALLREEVETLEAALEEERKRTTEERATLNRIQSENLRLKKEITDNRDRSEKSQYSDQYYQTKMKSIQEMHDEATAKLISYEELVGSKNEEIARFKKDLGQTKAQLMELKSEGETIAVLRAQVEVYQSDFRAEREAREAMASDRERLREDLRHLQMRNTQLTDELEAYQRRHYSQGQGPPSRSASEEPKDFRDTLNPEAMWDKLSNSSDKKVEDKKEENPEVDENLMYCPKCSKSFNELRPLEEHVNRCLDED